MNLQEPDPPPISEDEANSILERLYPSFWLVVQAAWKDWEDIPVKQRTRLTARARAGNVSDFLAFHARVILNQLPGVNIIPYRGLFLVGVDGRVVLRFKKLRDDKKTSNILTRQQRLLRENRAAMLPGIPPKAAILVVGYLLNITQTGIEAVLITCQNGNRLEYFIPIPKTQAKSSSNIIDMPKREEKQRPIVKPKKIEKKKEEGQ